VISSLGGYYRQHQEFEKAIQFFERVSALAPNESEYPILVVSCFSNIDCKEEALDQYERALHIDSSNKQYLKQLTQLTTEMGSNEKADHYRKMHRELIILLIIVG
jgi:tetratricopeptide (TPR) repeat protein